MQPDSNTIVSPKTQDVGRTATPTELNALKTATALHVSAMTNPRMDQKLIVQDSQTGPKEIGYMSNFEQCAAIPDDRLCLCPPNYAFCRQCHNAGSHGTASCTQFAHALTSCRGVATGDTMQQQEFRCALQPLGEEVMTSLTAQCACRPGLLRVVDTLFTHDPGKEQLHYVTDPGMVGETYGSVRRRINGAVVLGYRRSGVHSATALNPSDDTVLERGTELLVLAKHNKCSFQLTPVVTGVLCYPIGPGRKPASHWSSRAEPPAPTLDRSACVQMKCEQQPKPGCKVSTT